MLRFEWDENKNRKNIAKHGIDFKMATQVFEDERLLEFPDDQHSEYEERYLAIGNVKHMIMILTVVYTERGDAIRIISARRATKREEARYHAGF
ncbi:BrnT family toxin [uncultured Selenomonas sp.]|uniref:BrnT family toxin n=1 Tax=uncultured Selenomonas sp. TaxID=159275 RepID=UPI0025F34920|nr:BrnT family toxin [uncultured Selenomonas sp.]